MRCTFKLPFTKDRHIRELESKEIPLEYHAHLQKLIQIHRKTRGAEGVKGVSARDLLYHFKRFVFWLQEYELIGNVSKVYFSRIALRISTDATFGKPIPLDDVRKIYAAASG